MKKLILFSLCFCSLGVFAQVGINPTGNTPHASAGLDVDFTDKGLLPPRLTTAQRDAISNPAPGLRIYNMDTGCENYYSHLTANWMETCGTCPGPAAPTAGSHVAGNNQIEWHWNVVSGAAGYKWHTGNDYSTANDVGTATTYTQTGLSPGSPYTLYVWAYNSCGGSDSPLILNDTTLQPVKRVFVTSTYHDGGNFGGLSGADNICQTLADNQSLGGSWKAWLSSNSVSASSRLSHSTIPYKMLDGTLIANDWADLTDGSIANNITMDEQMVNSAGSYIWTNTTSAGNVNSANSSTACNNWTNSTGSYRANAGTPTQPPNAPWTDFTWLYCYNNAQFYCFEQ